MIKMNSSQLPEDPKYLCHYAEATIRAREVLDSCSNAYECGTVLLHLLNDFYDADWCGFLVLDHNKQTLLPFWWYLRTEGMMGGRVPAEPIFEIPYEEYQDLWEKNQPVMKSGAGNLMILPGKWFVPGFLIVKNPGNCSGRFDYMGWTVDRLAGFVREQMVVNILPIAESELNEDLEHDAAPDEVVVRMFGDLQISIGGEYCLDSKVSRRTCGKIFEYLMLNRNSFISTGRLIRCLFPEDDSLSLEAKLRNQIARFNKDLEPLLHTHIIVSKINAGYRINPELKIVSDFETFDEWSFLLQSVNDTEERINALCRIVNLYRGPFCSSYENESWTVSDSNRYHADFVRYAEELLKLLAESGDVARLNAYAERAFRIDPAVFAFVHTAKMVEG